MPKSVMAQILFNQECKRERWKEMEEAAGEGKGTGRRDQADNIPTCGFSDVPVVIHSWFLCGGGPQVIQNFPLLTHLLEVL